MMEDEKPAKGQKGQKGWIIVVVLVAVGLLIILKEYGKCGTCPFSSAGNNSITANAIAEKVGNKQTLPRLLELGADRCAACKMMMPVLEELRKKYPGKLKVDFIDVWKNRETAEKFKIETIPVQIFIAPSGKELFRHTGYYSEEEIIKKWRELGFELTGANKAATGKKSGK